MEEGSLPLECAGCGHANERGRVYCGRCGVKLISLVPVAHGRSGLDLEKVGAYLRAGVKDSPGQSVQQNTADADGGGGVRKPWGRERVFRVLIWMLLLVFCGVLLFQMGRRPEGLPQELTVSGDVTDLGEVLRRAADSREPRRFVVKEDAINGHLIKLQDKFAGEGGGGMRNGIVWMRCEPRLGKVLVERWVLGVPIYVEAAYRLEFERDVLSAHLGGGAIGRVRLPALAVRWLEPVFEPVWEVLKEDLGRMRAMQAVVLERGGVTLITRGR